MSAYKGSDGVKRGNPLQRKEPFDWGAFGLWLLSLILSMTPVYIAVLNHYIADQEFGVSFILECYGQHDVLWAFGTVLLFCCFSTFGKKGNTKKWAKMLAYIGIVIFVFLEITWYLFKYSNFENTSTDGLGNLVLIGSILLVVSILIATSLQISFIRNEGE